MTKTGTHLDRAHAAMVSAPQDDAARLAFFERIADAELFLLLAKDAEGDHLDPKVFPLEDGPFLLAFDREDRLSSFLGGPAPYAALSGRSIAAMLAGKGIGLGLNLGVAPSEFLMPPEAIDWLAETLGQRPVEVEARPEMLHAPSRMPEKLVEALAVKLAQAQGRAQTAYLAGITYRDGARGTVLAFIGAWPGAEPALAQAVSEALIFTGIDAAQLDVAFFDATDPMAARLAKVGLRFDLPEPEPTPQAAPPGSNPDKPPKLR